MTAFTERIRTRLRREILQRSLKVSKRCDLKRLGSVYGGWTVPVSLLSQSSICYCVGVGEDISFDLALIDTFGCDVFAFDPTPRSIDYVTRVAPENANYHFYPWGIWNKNEIAKFYAPRDQRHVSHSLVNLQQTSEYFTATCKRLSSLVDELGHREIDLLKLDIEGAEYDVLDTILEDEVSVNTICVEFDQPTTNARIREMVRKLEISGYDMVNIDGWNFTFVARTIGHN